MGTGAMAVPVPLKRPLPLTPVAVGAHLWLQGEYQEGLDDSSTDDDDDDDSGDYDSDRTF